jgi:hypothetical protein
MNKTWGDRLDAAAVKQRDTAMTPELHQQHKRQMLCYASLGGLASDLHIMQGSANGRDMVIPRPTRDLSDE